MYYGNSLLNYLENETNFKVTENGALAHQTTKKAVLDLFALGGAYRNRSEDDCIFLFKKAFKENPEYALKCLFYLRDARGGQGERRFFRVCFNWLAKNVPGIVEKNIENVAIFGRYDDILYSCDGTPAMEYALAFVKKQLALDLESKTPSLLAKWLPSENASSEATKRMGGIVRDYIGLTHKQYRKILSELRSRINIVEKLMSEGRWDEIEFDKIPSKAGLIYKNAFARRDIIAKKYEEFAKDKTTTVNAAALYPYEIVKKARTSNASETDRAILEKYWENQIDVLEGKPCKMMCVVDTSGSMTGWGRTTTAPIDMAIGLGMYCAERVGGPFKDHYISFSSRPQLIKVDGVDFYDKVKRIYRTNLCDNTDLVRTFQLLKTATKMANPEDRLDTVVVISDMEIDSMTTGRWSEERTATEMERVRKEWEAEGLKMPKLVYWNVDARQDTFLDLEENVSFCSGASPTIFKQIATGKTGWDLFLDAVVNNERYSVVTI